MKLIKLVVIIAICFGGYKYFSGDAIFNSSGNTHLVSTNSYNILFPENPKYTTNTTQQQNINIKNERYSLSNSNSAYTLNIVTTSGGKFNMSMNQLKNQLLRNFGGKVTNEDHITKNGINGKAITATKNNGETINMQVFNNGSTSYTLTIHEKDPMNTTMSASEFFTSFVIKN